MTALMIAIENKAEAVVKLLIKERVDLDSTDLVRMLLAVRAV